MERIPEAQIEALKKRPNKNDWEIALLSIVAKVNEIVDDINGG